MIMVLGLYKLEYSVEETEGGKRSNRLSEMLESWRQTFYSGTSVH